MTWAGLGRCQPHSHLMPVPLLLPTPLSSGSKGSFLYIHGLARAKSSTPRQPLNRSCLLRSELRGRCVCEAVRKLPEDEGCTKWIPALQRIQSTSVVRDRVGFDQQKTGSLESWCPTSGKIAT